MGNTPSNGALDGKNGPKACPRRRFLLPGAPRRAGPASAARPRPTRRRAAGRIFCKKAVKSLLFLEIISFCQRWTFALGLCYNLVKIAEPFGIMWS